MILVTGSNGFIGSEIISYFSKKGYDTVGINIDIRNKNALRPLFIGADFVIHAAGKVKKEIPNLEDYYTINVLGTRNVCSLCIENGSKLIHLSSIASSDGTNKSIKFYVESKQESQKLVQNYCHLYGLKACILKLGVIYNEQNNTHRPGPRYPIEKLIEDIEKIINSSEFKNFQLIDYSSMRA